MRVRIKLEKQSLLQVGDRFSIVEDNKPHFEIVEEQSPGIFKVKRIPSGIIDENQEIPPSTGDFPCWKFEEEE